MFQESDMDGRTIKRMGLVVPLTLLVASLAPSSRAVGQSKSTKASDQDKKTTSQKLTQGDTLPDPPASILDSDTRPVDLPSALELAGVGNPQILLARERITEAMALRQLAVAQFLPSLNAGTNFNNHTGPVQQAAGAILNVNRGSLYMGLGAGAVGAGTVNVPGIAWRGNVSQVLYASLVTRQFVRQRQFESDAVRNDVLLRVSSAYLNLLRAQAARAIAIQTRGEAQEVARVTANYAQAGQGRQADADRAATELQQRELDVVQAEGDMLGASARLAQVLNLDPALRLQVNDAWAIPAGLVPEPIPLPELIAIALLQRPELQARQAAIQAALLELEGARLLPFSPSVVLGYSAGSFGGGSNLASQGIVQPDGSVIQQSRFGNFGGRQDIDAVVYWTLRNLGVGNVALIRAARSNHRIEELRQVEVLDRVRMEVAVAFARARARLAQIEINERAISSSQKAFKEDFFRTRNREGLPIEVLDSLRLLGRSRNAYLDSIIEYNRAQFDLYVALGQPPANFLARPVPTDLAPPPGGAENPPVHLKLQEAASPPK
jgi:outer membrane protein TolC